MPFDAGAIRPSQDGTGEFAAIVAGHHRGLAPVDRQPVQFPRHAGAGERGVGHQRQALARAIVDNGQDAEAAPVGELSRYEVGRPAFVGRHRNHQHRRPGPDRRLAATSAARRKFLLPIEPEQLLVLDHVALSLEQKMQPPAAEAAALLGDCPHALAKAGIVRPDRLVSCGSSRWLYTPAVRSSRIRR
jgi:hypothetical protein